MTTPDDDNSGGLSLQGLKILAIFLVLMSACIGAGSPLLFAYCCSASDEEDTSSESDQKEMEANNRKKKQRRVQMVLKLVSCAAIGIIMSTSLIHVIPEGIHTLESSSHALFKRTYNCINNSDATTSNATSYVSEENEDESPYPFGFLFIMLAIFTVYFITTEVGWYGTRRLKQLKRVACDKQEEARLSSLIKLYVLVIGIAIHSVVFGITLGLSVHKSSVRTLLIILCPDSLFDGLAVGSLIVAAKMSNLKALGFIAFFSLGVPLGIAIGLGVNEGETSPVTRGVSQCLSGGIILFNVCCEMLPHIFGSHEHHSHGPNVDEVEIEEKEKDHHKKSAPQDRKLSLPTFQNSTTSEDEELSSQNNNTNNSNNEPDSSNHAVPVAAAKEEEKEKEEEEEESKPELDFHDEHHDDDSLFFRVSCYCCIIVGCSVQSLLGMWE